MFLISPPEYGISSHTAFTSAPSSVMRLAMIRPISPEPRITASLPGRHPFWFTSFCAVPALKIPAGRVPAIFSAPFGRSRQPMASTTAFASTVKIPSSSLAAVMILSGDTASTMVLYFTEIPSSRTFFSYFQAYSGPVSSSPKRCSPKPLWMHCCKIPPRCSSRSRIRISLTPFS